MTLDLVTHWKNARFRTQVFHLDSIEIANSNCFNEPSIDKFLHGTPCVDMRNVCVSNAAVFIA